MPDGIASRLGTATHTVAYTASDERLLDTVLAMPSASTRSRAGVRIGGGLEVTAITGPDRARVQPGGGIINDTGAGAGSYVFVIPAVVDIALAARPSAGQTRLDWVVATIKNVDERPADGTNEVDLAVYAGSPTSGTPSPPTGVPAGALLLAELTVPASGTILPAKPPPRTAALGGVLPVASQAEEDAISPVYDGLIIYREDVDLFKGRVNGVWKAFGAGIRQFVRKSADEGVSSANTGTTLQNDDHLSFAVQAGFTYRFELHLFVVANAAGTNGDIKVAFTFPAGTMDFSGIAPNEADLTTGTNANTEFIARRNATSGATNIPYALSPSGTEMGITVRGTFIATAAGTVQLQWAQQTASGNSSKVLTGSTLLADLVA